MSKVAHPIAKPPSISVMRGGKAVAEISTGPRNRNANGFSRPPVRNSSTASSAISNAKSQAARWGSRRCISGKRMRNATLSQAARAITDRQAQIGNSKSSAQCTTTTAVVWPTTASQRRRTSVSSRTLRSTGVTSLPVGVNTAIMYDLDLAAGSGLEVSAGARRRGKKYYVWPMWRPPSELRRTGQGLRK